MDSSLILLGILPVVFSVILTPLMIRLAYKWNILDQPGDSRKIHSTPTPLLGGVAVIVAFSLGVLIAWPHITDGYLLPKHLVGVLSGGMLLLIGGVLDDRLNLSPKKQLLFPFVAALCVIASGIGIDYVTNPFGEVLRLDTFEWTVFSINGVPYQFTLFSDIFTLMWMMGMIYTTKLLDSLDGLVSGVAVIGSLVICMLSITQTVFQPETATLALIAASAFFGFLLFNWHPARIFLGESGSLFAGFILGVLSIVSGGKIATAILIMGIPILDVIWVIIRRTMIEKKSPFQADRKHLTHRLLDSGLSHRQVALLLYLLTAVFGFSSIFLQSRSKFFAFGVMVITMVVVAGIIVRRYTRQK